MYLVLYIYDCIFVSLDQFGVDVTVTSIQLRAHFGGRKTLVTSGGKWVKSME